jgi:dipeptidyl aminopeptidase/acylaminoacyl peptidase
VRFDPATRTSEVILADPDYDVTGVVLHPETGQPELASVERERSDLVVLDPALETDVERLRACDAGDLHLFSRDHADRRFLVAATHDDGPLAYYLYDREAGQPRFLFHHRSELTHYRLARVEPFVFSASDGLVIHGYVTAPPRGERRALPAVLHVHGGHWGVRHHWGFGPTSQWLANRGYLCLEINYRGSGGYGREFLNASAHEWAGRMHSDLIEGARWAVERGWADPDRLAIFGESYGGYAALVGAAFTPDVFRCAVDLSGPSNLLTLLETLPPYWVGLRQVFSRLLGDPQQDRDLLWARSPLSRVDAIRIPILVGQGAHDPRVTPVESEQIVAALARRGIECAYLFFPDEGHGLAKPANRLRFYGAAENFLAQHLLGETPGVNRSAQG